MQTKKYEDGVYTITNDEYHSSSAISRSQLMLLDKIPYHFWYEVLSGQAEKKESTPAMKFGSLFHTLVLEPEKFHEEYFLISQKTMPVKGTNPYKLIIEEAKGRTPITQEQLDKVSKMSDLVRKQEIVKTLLIDSKFENSLFWTDEETSLQFKSKPDIWSTKMIVDLKTTSDINPEQFKRSALNYGYYLQAGMAYEACRSLGFPFEMFVILACEKEPPYVPIAFIATEKFLQYGIAQFNLYKRLLKKCLDSNDWPGYQVQELDLPSNISVSDLENAA